ncbi:MAG: glycosyltransferase family 2 protein [Acidobacteria bacterium]|nr:glycosyltransferase family 2 protein [Acidobacteriota bacterium]
MTTPQAVRAPGTLETAGDGASRHASVDVAVVIPAYDERTGIGTTIERLRSALVKSPYSFDIVVVDDGSTDGTGEEARAHGARVVRLPRNRGYGAALKAGILESTSGFVAIIDADGTYPPEQVPHLMTLTDEADMVVGARSPQDRSIPKKRRPAKWLIARLASYLAEQEIPDINSGLRVMRRSVLMQFFHILPQGFSFTTTITLAVLCSGGRVTYEPITCETRLGSSKLRATDFSSFVMLVLRTVVLFNPLKVFLPLGTTLFLIGFLKFIYDLFLWNLSETAVMGFLAAIVVWSVGLLADMISRLQLRPPRLP